MVLIITLKMDRVTNQGLCSFSTIKLLCYGVFTVIYKKSSSL